MKPRFGKTYRLTYYGEKSERGKEIISKDFEYLARRRNGYYFLSTDGVTDLVVKDWQFEQYLKNTIKSLQ